VHEAALNGAQSTICTLQHTAPHGNTLQHTATHCNTLQHEAALKNKSTLLQVASTQHADADVTTDKTVNGQRVKVVTAARAVGGGGDMTTDEEVGRGKAGGGGDRRGKRRLEEQLAMGGCEIKAATQQAHLQVHQLQVQLSAATLAAQVQRAASKGDTLTRIVSLSATHTHSLFHFLSHTFALFLSLRVWRLQLVREIFPTPTL